MPSRTEAYLARKRKIIAKSPRSTVKRSKLCPKVEAAEKVECVLQVKSKFKERRQKGLKQCQCSMRNMMYFCKLLRGPQYRTLSGAAISVSPFSSGLTIFK